MRVFAIYFKPSPNGEKLTEDLNTQSVAVFTDNGVMYHRFTNPDHWVKFAPFLVTYSCWLERIYIHVLRVRSENENYKAVLFLRIFWKSLVRWPVSWMKKIAWKVPAVGSTKHHPLIGTSEWQYVQYLVGSEKSLWKSVTTWVTQGSVLQLLLFLQNVSDWVNVLLPPCCIFVITCVRTNLALKLKM